MAKLAAIISGGQTGADRAALDVALRFGIPHGGAVPHGRKAEDGPLAAKYLVTELASGDYAVRTRKNVAESDGTLIVSHGNLQGGSALTLAAAGDYEKPVLHLDLTSLPAEKAVMMLHEFVASHQIGILNIAGPRASEDPEIYGAVTKLLTRFLIQPG